MFHSGPYVRPAPPEVIGPILQVPALEVEPIVKKSTKPRKRLPGEKLLKQCSKNRIHSSINLNMPKMQRGYGCRKSCKGKKKKGQYGWGMKARGAFDIGRLQADYGRQRPPQIMPQPVLRRPPLPRRLPSQKGGCKTKKCRRIMRGHGVTQGGGGLILAGQRGGSMGCQKGGSMGCQKGGSMGCQKGGSMGCQKGGAMGCQSGGAMGCQTGGFNILKQAKKGLNKVGKFVTKGAKSAVNWVEHDPMALPTIALGAATGGLASLPAAAIMGMSAGIAPLAREMGRVSQNHQQRQYERGQLGAGYISDAMKYGYEGLGQFGDKMLDTMLRGTTRSTKKKYRDSIDVGDFVEENMWDVSSCNSQTTKKMSKIFVNKFISYMGIDLDNPETRERSRLLGNCLGRGMCELMNGMSDSYLGKMTAGISRFFKGKPQVASGYWKSAQKGGSFFGGIKKGFNAIGKNIKNNPAAWGGDLLINT